MNSMNHGNNNTRPWRTNEQQTSMVFNQSTDTYPEAPANLYPDRSAGTCRAVSGVNPGCCTTRCSTSDGKDYGPAPYVENINEQTLENPYFRRALWTGSHLQLTLMCIGPGQEIGLERHPDTDQFLRLEQGQGVAMMGRTSDNLTYQKDIAADYAIFIPAGTWHNVLNTGTVPMKLYSIYAPPHHPHGRIHCTKADSDADE